MIEDQPDISTTIDESLSFTIEGDSRNDLHAVAVSIAEDYFGVGAVLEVDLEVGLNTNPAALRYWAKCFVILEGDDDEDDFSWQDRLLRSHQPSGLGGPPGLLN